MAVARGSQWDGLILCLVDDDKDNEWLCVNKDVNGTVQYKMIWDILFHLLMIPDRKSITYLVFFNVLYSYFISFTRGIAHVNCKV